MKILVTGCCGFIGFHLCKQLLENNKNKVFGIDIINDYYDVKLKKDRLNILKKNKKFFKFFKIDITNKKIIENNFNQNKYDYVIHLAAQAGVRYSLKNPRSYLDNNINGFFNILEASKNNKIKHLIYASTSSVYGDNTKFPLKENFSTDKPLTFYAASKKCNEIMAYSYSNLYKLKTTGLRFFTVYGSYGRPDMALSKFVNSILNSKKLELYNKGNHYRDFTYVDDVIKSIIKLIKKGAKEKIPFQIFNIGNGKPNYLKDFLIKIENELMIKARVKNLRFQKGDVYKTHADTKKLSRAINFRPSTSIQQGIEKFIRWYKEYYK